MNFYSYGSTKNFVQKDKHFSFDSQTFRIPYLDSTILEEISREISFNRILVSIKEKNMGHFETHVLTSKDNYEKIVCI